jgi:hypothetical protein
LQPGSPPTLTPAPDHRFEAIALGDQAGRCRTRS